MNAFQLTATVVLALGIVHSASAVVCASCEGSVCIPPPAQCQELGRRACSCCDECRVPVGGACGAYTVECESALVCFTNEGVFLGRPSVDSHATGKCIAYEDIPATIAPAAAPRALRSILRQRN